MSFLISDHLLGKVGRTSLILAALACVALVLIRLCFAFSFSTPYLLTTTGCEEESLFSMWKFTQGKAVYTDPNQIPYAASYFNWGYYYLYGPVIKYWLNLLHLDPTWIATIGRLITLLFTLVIGGVSYLTLRSFGDGGWLSEKPWAFVWTLLITASPLMGFWSMTVRPDVGAVMFELSGLCLVLCYLRAPHLLLIVAAMLLFYAGWSFKQTAVSMISASALVLFLIKDWRAFILLCGGWWLLVIFTFFISGAVYRECVLYSQGHLPLLISLGLKNIFRAELKSAFFFVAVAAMFYAVFKRLRSHSFKSSEILLAAAVVISLGLSLLTSCKVGANDNYFIPTACVAMLGLALNVKAFNSRSLMGALIVCSWFMIVVVALSPTGRTFNLGYRDFDSIHRVMAQKLAHLPGPIFSIECYSNLPWMHKTGPYFVRGYAYDMDREAGVPCEKNGWKGLVDEGYFGTVVIDPLTHPPASLFEKYELVDEYKDSHCDYKFYRRKP